MKLTIPVLGVISAIVALASIGAIYAGSYQADISKADTPIGAAFLVGNVKVTQFDENQNVVAIRHGSNHITATGMSIIMGQVFAGVNQTYLAPINPAPDTANVTGRVQWMEIGTEGDPITYNNRLRWNNTDIITSVGSLQNPTTCVRVEAAIDNSTLNYPIGPDFGNPHKAPSSCKGSTNCNARANVTAVAQFQGNICSETGIDEAGIFTASTTECNTGTCGMLFARNTFGSVNLGMLDTLQLEWEFTFRDS